MFVTPVRNSATTLVVSILATAASFAIVATPARAAETETFRNSVEKSVAETMQLPSSTTNDVVTVAVRINADGSVANATIAKSGGNARYNAEALRTARAVSYPAGKARTIAMVLGFGREVGVTDLRAAKRQVAALLTDKRQLLADKTSGQPIG